DHTIFYPQGGGQPYDTGKIKSVNGVFIVEQVRYFEGVVKHIGHFESGSFEMNEEVELEIDQERRQQHAKLHSGGHLVDMAVYEVKPEWIPSKGYHFPQGPYVEYKGSMSEDEKESLKLMLEKIMDEKVQQSIPVTVKFVEKNEIGKFCRHVPENIASGKPTRIVLFGDFGVPCGGTHVDNLSTLKKVIIRKIKQEKDMVRVSYDIT
ncbi:MAG: hypothetical protein KA035_04210, partial [Candidatus Levybacteria bacterium]|nr:hypothetical protein [Candidatus Levybacteria bacterium]